MIRGTVQHDNGQWFVEHQYPAFNDPEMITIRWRITGARRQAHYGPAPDLIDGLAVSMEHGNPWQAYERGGYLVLDTEHNGTISTAPLPCPRVGKTTQTRYRDGRWEKCTARTAWTAA